MLKFKKNKLISNKELDMMLYEKGRQYVLTMYCIDILI